MRYSREVLRWQAPTRNVDGTTIDYPLDYELGSADPVGVLVALVSVVGTLQPAGNYEAPLDQMSFDLGTYDLALRAINRDEPGNISQWSNRISLVVTPDPIPAAPVLLDA